MSKVQEDNACFMELFSLQWKRFTGSQLLSATKMTLLIIIVGLFVTTTSGQSGSSGDLPQCADNINTNVQQRGVNRIRRNAQVVVTTANFTCDGRLNRIMASMLMESGSNEFLFQVWRPSFTDSNIYTRVGQIALRESDVTLVNNSGIAYWLVNMSLTADEGIEFHAGDAMGYYHPSNPSYRLHNNPGVRTHVSLTLNSEVGPTDTFNRSNVTSSIERQPLFNVAYDTPCNNLSAPANGEILSCSSGRVGVGYEGDTCSFTCITGYELTGSDTRTCQSDGSWSGSNVTCNRVMCSSLTNPDNGMISCSLGDDGIPSYEDTCIFTCDTGYELTGIRSDARTCQNDGNWSGGNTTCNRVYCPALMNGVVQCPNGATIGAFEDTCTFSCNAGYELQGSNNGTCLADQSWSGGDPLCGALNCSTSPPLNNSQLQSSCDTQYQSTCTTICVDGYTGVGGSYTCVVTDEDTNSVGWNGSTSCHRDTSQSSSSSDSQGISNSLIIGGVIGGVLLITIIILLFIIIIILLYRNKKSRGRLDIANTAVSYKKAANLDQSTNVIIHPNPSYNLVKRESNAYSTDPAVTSYDKETAEAYEEITLMTIKNPSFDDTVSNDYDYVVRAEDLLATVN